MRWPALLCVVFAVCSPGAHGEWRGVDLSYVNELEDCGAVYRDEQGPADPYNLMADAGANLVRLRLWVNPTWTRYSTLTDVTRSMRRARAAGLRVLLDFHYSDDWAHPGKQLRPRAWPPANDVVALAARINDYTKTTLRTLEAEVGLPEIVAIGNEINTEVLVDRETAEDATIDWPRNASLLRAGVSAVRDIAAARKAPIEIMLHIAQPENVQPWFDAALRHGVTDFDHIGISYYPKWSRVPFSELEPVIRRIVQRYDKGVAVVETAYPWTLESSDSAGNLLGEDSLVPGYPASPSGQAAFLGDLRARVQEAGGEGVIYWEPAWVSTSCKTRWGEGSHWENATLFDFERRPLPGMKRFLSPDPRSGPED